MPLPKIKPISATAQKEDLTQPVPALFEANDVFMKSKREQYVPWDINELEEFFGSYTCRDKMVRLDECSTIIDVPLFIASHLATVKAHNGNPRYKPYLERLRSLKTILTHNMN